MNEIEYIKATNWVKIRIALSIYNEILPGTEYNLTSKKYEEIRLLLVQLEQLLGSTFTLEEEKDD